jgi:hypothetical protein
MAPHNSRWQKLRSKIKWPGWSFIVLAIVTGPPNWFGVYDFWIIQGRLEGVLGISTSIVLSPLFTAVLTVVGLTYLMFVGEPKRGVQRHPALPYIAWAIAAVCAAAVVTTLGYGYLTLQATRIQAANSWKIEPAQRDALIAAVKNEPASNVHILAIIDALAVDYTKDLARAFRRGGWTVEPTINGIIPQNLVGIHVLVPTTAPAPPSAETIERILKAAGIPYAVTPFEELRNAMFLMVGHKP